MKVDAELAGHLRILFLAGLFGGLKAGLANGKSEPGSVPAIYGLIEGLAGDPEVDLITVLSGHRSALQAQQIEPIGESVIRFVRGLAGAAVLGTIESKVGYKRG